MPRRIWTPQRYGSIASKEVPALQAKVLTSKMTYRGNVLKHERTGVAVTVARSTVVRPSVRAPDKPLQVGSPSSSAAATLTVRLRCVSESEEGYDPRVDSAFLVACRNADDNRIRQLMTCRALTSDMVNCRDKTGKTGVSHICVNGNLPLLELITPIPSLDVNIGDNEGNTPLHFASQAGHVDIVHHLISHFKNLQIDQRNQLGFTALMKASLQGRTKCVKLLLTAGASPVLRDHGRGLCAAEWARFCGRQVCAEVLEKFTKNAVSGRPPSLRAHLQDLEKCNSEPNLQFLLCAESKESWLRQKLKRAFRASDCSRKLDYSLASNLTNAALCASSPLIPTASVKKGTPLPPPHPAIARSVSCSDRVTLPKVQVTEALMATENRPSRGSDSVGSRPNDVR